MKKEKRIGDRLVHEAPDWGTPPPPSVEDEVVPCTDHPGRENHCVSGQCGACWLCTTKVGPTVRLGAEHPWVPEAEPAPFVPAPGWEGGAFGPRTRDRMDEMLDEVRALRTRIIPPRRTPIDRLLERIGRARTPEIRYQPLGPYAPGGVLDGPTLAELQPHVNHFAQSIRQAYSVSASSVETPMPYDSQLDMPDEDTYSGPEVADGLIEALRNCDRPGFTTKVVRDAWALPDEDGPHEHTWIDERELCSTWVRRHCPGCGADESYDDAPELAEGEHRSWCHLQHGEGGRCSC